MTARTSITYWCSTLHRSSTDAHWTGVVLVRAVSVCPASVAAVKDTGQSDVTKPMAINQNYFQLCFRRAKELTFLQLFKGKHLVSR